MRGFDANAAVWACSASENVLWGLTSGHTFLHHVLPPHCAVLRCAAPAAQHSWDLGLLMSGIPLCVLSRAANVFPCSYLANLGEPGLGCILAAFHSI